MDMERFSIGVGDRFGRQGKAQLAAVMALNAAGVRVAPVWNKSYREHGIIGSTPADVRAEADAAVAALRWEGSYYVDADHISLKTVDPFIAPSDFFTLDVAETIGQAAADADIEAFIGRHEELVGTLQISGITRDFRVSREDARRIAGTYLLAVREAAALYRYIGAVRGEGSFVTEVSMDETDAPQTPVELLFILAALADEGVLLQTIAPKFSGRFNKSVDYVGDVAAFAREFEEDVLVVRYAVARYGLPAGLKLSVHSGSDKFSLYAPIAAAVEKHGAGLHLKTAGTTWLEELIGLAEGGGAGLEIAKTVYRTALGRFDELCGPYASVIDIDPVRLPAAGCVDGWDGDAYAGALRHDPSSPAFNPDFRQLLHVGYKVAAELGDAYLQALDDHAESVGRNVTENLLERHLKPLFLSQGPGR